MHESRQSGTVVDGVRQHRAMSITACGALAMAVVALLAPACGAAVTIDLGSGRDGDLVVGSQYTTASPFRVDSVRTLLTTNAAAGATTINVASASGFATGQEILLTRLHGPGGSSATTANYEYRKVQSVSGNTITLDAPLSRAFSYSSPSPAGQVRVQVVPHYRNVTVQGVISTDTWGVIAMRAKGTVNITSSGAISADGDGHYGGTGGLGIGNENENEGRYGTSYAARNWPGFDNLWQRNNGAGGGGRPHYYPGNGGGGGGGHRTAGVNGKYEHQASYADPGYGEGGNAYGESSLELTIHAGSGGGGGNASSYLYGGAGGAGGGVILLSAGNLDVDGVISARGINGGQAALTSRHNASTTGWAGGGGGGAGGTIWLSAHQADFTNAPSVEGGIGGNGTKDNSTTAQGVTAPTLGGGNGGSGFYRLDVGQVSGNYLAYSGAVVNYVVVPEPGIGLTALSAGALLLRRRR